MDKDFSPAPSALADFIRRHIEDILVHWEEFARSIPCARHLETASLRDHAHGMLMAISRDLEHVQTAEQQALKSRGRSPQKLGSSEAQLHGSGRAAAGFSVTDTISEFRALRASVLRHWNEVRGSARPIPSRELIRFNEAIDQALSESLERYALDKEASTRRFDTLLSSSPDLNAIIGCDGQIMYANHAFNALFDGDDPVAGNDVRVLSTGGGALFDQVARVCGSRQPCTGEIDFLRVGAPTTYRCVALPIDGGDGRTESVAITARDISELKSSEDQIRRNAYYDSLTQLPNRILFLDRLEQEVGHAVRTGNRLALMFIDLDGFKEINDRCGHAAGDHVLRECAQRLVSCVRSTDTVARLGGDEFTAILSDAGNAAQIELISQKIVDALAQPYSLDPEEMHVTCSIGIALCPDDTRVPGDLLRDADQAMLMAKQSGRNRFSFFTREMRDVAWARLKLMHELRHALALSQLTLYYQPIVEIATGAVVKAEALLRWHHPQAGLVMPEQFIGLAEEGGLIADIGKWVMDEALVWARRWSQLKGEVFQVSVNKSPVEFTARPGAPMVQAGTNPAELPGAQIAVEITEGVMLKDSPAARSRLEHLQALGIQLAIDDFGTGYSSLSYLKKFKVDFLKIDRSFISDMMSNQDNQIFAETIIVLAHRLGLKVIAEGVETRAQHAWLAQAGCDYGQGFLFGEPAPPEAMERLLMRAAPAG